MARCVISRRRNNSVAFGAKRTFSELRLQNRIYEYATSYLRDGLSSFLSSQLLTYTDDVDLQAGFAEWESFYNLSRPHGAFNGKAPYETLHRRL